MRGKRNNLAAAGFLAAVAAGVGLYHLSQNGDTFLDSNSTDTVTATEEPISNSSQNPQPE